MGMPKGWEVTKNRDDKVTIVSPCGERVAIWNSYGEWPVLFAFIDALLCEREAASPTGHALLHLMEAFDETAAPSAVSRWADELRVAGYPDYADDLEAAHAEDIQALELAIVEGGAHAAVG